MKKFSLKKYSLKDFFWHKLIKTTIIVCSLYVIFTSESFLEKISPKNYWESKANFYFRTVKTDQIKIKSLQLDLEKELLSSSLHKKEAFLESAKNDLNFDKTYLNKKNSHFKKTEKIKKEIFKTLEKEKKDKRNLEIAQNKVKDIT